MEQTKIDILLSSIRTLNKTEFNENLTEENNWENILLELEMLQKTVSDQKRRSKVIIKTILECAAGDYLKKLPISSSLDDLDSICIAFNTYVEELEENIKIEANKVDTFKEKPLSTTKKAIKILVAEDNIINQMLMSTILLKEGFEIFMAADGEKAVEELEKNEYDIVLMDLMMPIMNGFEATEYIRSKMNNVKKSIPIIAVSADVTKGVKEKCLSIGMNDYISKPYASEQLIGKIRQLIVN